ncbi:hypothetical protein MNBD_GAMMA18-1520 [hydrothermal vent metagenome]|uniref:Amine oxidase domain-containing protein n=1 Tax=hydrothermal vent metagenome TaxID=652676 RepID=A0A3B0ZTN9_9ZZZZ
MNSNIYDFTIIGTSPLSMMEVVLRAGEGKRCCIIDRNERLGGSWRTFDCMGLYGIETTPHIFLPAGDAYEIMSKALCCQMAPWERPVYLLVQNSTFFGNRKIEIQQNAYSFFVLGVLATLEQKKWNIIKRTSRFIRYISGLSKLLQTKRKSTSIMYPKYGLTQWFKHVSELFVEKNIDRFMETDISLVEKKDGIITLVDTDGNTYNTKHICINRNTRFDVIKIDGKPLEIDYVLNSSFHVAFIVNNTKPGNFVHTVGVKDLMLINDVTDYAEGIAEKYPGCRLIVARFENSDAEYDYMKEKCFQDLLEIGYLDSNSEIIESHVWHLREKKLSNKCIKNVVAKMNGSVSVVVTSNLGLMSTINNLYNRKRPVSE